LGGRCARDRAAPAGCRRNARARGAGRQPLPLHGLSRHRARRARRAGRAETGGGRRLRRLTRRLSLGPVTDTRQNWLSCFAIALTVLVPAGEQSLQYTRFPHSFFVLGTIVPPA